MIPQAWLVGILGALLGVAGAGWQGYRMGKDSVIADQAREDKVRQETRDDRQCDLPAEAAASDHSTGDRT